MAFAVGLLRLRFGAIEVAHDFRDRDDVARVDLRFVFLGATRPHGALDASAALEGLERLLHQRRLGQFAHANIGDLGGRHAQRHLVLDEVDDEQLELRTGDLLLLDGQDLADAVSWIDDEFVGLEALTLGHDLLFLDLRRGCSGLHGRLGSSNGGLGRGGSNRGLRSNGLGSGSLDGSGLGSRLCNGRFRGRFGSLVRHCASFVLRGLCSRRRLGSGPTLGCATAGRGDFFGLLMGSPR